MMFTNPRQGDRREDQFETAQTYLGRERRMLALRGPIIAAPGRWDQFSVTFIMDDIVAMNHADPTKPIYLIIDSPGGELDAGMMLYDLIRMSRAPIITIGQDCVSPETRVLTQDLRWVPAGELRVGDELWGFDEDSRAGRVGWQRTKVTSHVIAPREAFKTTLKDGTELISTAGHLWKTSSGWKRTDQLNTRRQSKLLRYLEPWKVDASAEAGYLAGFFDGEGSTGRGKLPATYFGQNYGATLERVKRLLVDKGFALGIGDTGVAERVKILGGLAEQLRFLGSVRPTRLLPKVNHQGQNLIAVEHSRVVKNEAIGVRDVVVMETSSKTFFAEGFGAHNCASMATVILAAGHQRLAFPHARLMLHLPSMVFQGDSKLFEIRQKEMERLKDEMVDAYVECGVKARLDADGKDSDGVVWPSVSQKIQNDIGRELWLSASSGVEYGLVDRVATTEDLFGVQAKAQDSGFIPDVSPVPHRPAA